MTPILIALAGCMAAWTLVLRRGVGARSFRATPALAVVLDAAPVLLGFAALLAATARPLLSGLGIVVLTIGLSVGDRVKRQVLQEPVVFADRAELPELVRHPGLYFPFAGGPLMIAAVLLLAAAAIAGLAWAEPPAWHRTASAAAMESVIALLAAAGCFVLPGLVGTLPRLAALYNARLAPTRDPAHDAAALGPLACLAVHATLAAAERPGRRAVAPALLRFPDAPGPIVMVQAESFLDPARLHPALAGLLPAFEAAWGTARQRGRLAVPAWGANTVRSEFAVLSGLSDAELGLDHYNPYERFARAPGPPLPSIAAAARAAGYRTVFVHPFDLGFYGRRHILPRLGFDELIGPAAFTNARRSGLYVADEALADATAGLLRQHGPRCFVFIATMEAHGPWDAAGPTCKLPPAVQSLPQAHPLGRWLHHLQGTDRMLGALTRALAPLGGWLAFYGDHQPSLPETLAAAQLSDRRTDYLIWNAEPGAGVQTLDLEAHRLGAALLAAMRA